MRKRIQGLMIPLLMAAALGTAHAQMQTRGENTGGSATQPTAPVTTATGKPARSPIVVDGKGWLAATAEERRAFLIGMANMIVAEAAYAKRNNAAAPGAGTKITETLQTMNLWQASERITTWYNANPDKLGAPVMGVVWRDLVEQSSK
ncbi:hypothetical protein [Bordetella genomosp. 13]|uniref:hypothetical protein n=1 Tax=Bordetella genomosp. 13 TaxID=463040 RepID=UPI0011A2882E|nr:hypothetical protein [Bordetella genomosp. 13]